MNPQTANLLRAALKAAIDHGIDYIHSQIDYIRSEKEADPQNQGPWKVRLTTAQTRVYQPSLNHFPLIAFHPQPELGICVRAEWDGLFLIWNGGYQKHLIKDISASDWQIPLDHKGRLLPMEIKRVGNVMGIFAVDVQFIEVPPQC
jgi:hypothetical protein